MSFAEHLESQRVNEVRADCELDGPGSRRCRSFFSAVSGIVFGNDPSIRVDARRWARNNTGEDNSTVIGAIRLTATLEPRAITFVPEFVPR